MLGDLIGELKGKITGNRVLSVECCPKIEVSFQDIGKILDVDVSNMGTYWAIFKEEGGLYGEGNGVIFSKDGEMITWTGQGVGKMIGKGSEWRASVFYNTTSDRFSRLNNIIGVVEYKVDEEGNTEEKIWEWK